MANTWGNNYWGINSWGEQDDVTATVTGSSVSSSIGTSTSQANADVVATSLSLSFIIPGVVAGASAEVSPTGVSLSITPGSAVIAIGANATGSSIFTAITGVTIDENYLIGSGWGRDTWGNLGWGVNYSALAGGVNGLSLTASIGNEDAFTDVIVGVNSVSLQTEITPVGTSGTSDNEIAHTFLIGTSLGAVSLEGTATVSLTGIGMTPAIGVAVAGLLTEVAVTGSALTLTLGDDEQTGSAVVSPTGTPLTTVLGDTVQVSKYDVTGSSLVTNIGATTITGNAIIIPTGIALTISQNTTNIIAWEEVSVGTSVTWTDVDLAA